MRGRPRSSITPRRTGFALNDAHSRIECTACHTTGNYKDKVPKDCHGCHLAQDSHAGRFGAKCESCHSEAQWKPVEYDHLKLAKFALLGAHLHLGCNVCHSADVAQQKLGTGCVDCHKSQDPHGGALGGACDQCHNNETWVGRVRFDHDLTRYPLLGQHVLAGCAQCHASQSYKGAADTCIACHRAEDVHKGGLGEDCAACHSPDGWNLWEFNHAKETGFALSGAHRKLTCADCHREPPKKVKLAKECNSCHEKDDIHVRRIRPSVPTMPHHRQLLGRKHPLMTPARAIVEFHSGVRSARGWLRLAALLLFVCLPHAADAAQIGPSKFDHLTTGYELLGAHLIVPCESCHVGAIFKGTPRECVSCHSQGARITATFKGQDHVLSSARCEACHTEAAWAPASHFDHQEVQGSCATCHNGVTATGMGPNHIASTTDCGACHSVYGWKPVLTVDHTQVNGTCASCHNGTVATGKPGNHIVTTDSCDNCHTTLAWKPANVKHVGNISNCAACHNGTIATGKTATHMSTTTQCAACHSVVVWKPQTTVDHTQVIGTCYSCHNGTIAAGKAANHPTNTDNTCENCHATTAWTPANVNHNGITSNCVSCHNNKTATGKAGTHIATSDSCQACHSVLVWNPPVTVDHTQVLGTCASCHNGSTALGRPANHIPAAADCGVCHLTTVAFGPGTPMNHTGITSNCASCHETGKSWYGVTIVVRPSKAQDPNHPTTGDCSACHASTTSFTVDTSGGKPANHIPTSQSCTLCHGDPGDYSIYKMNHAGITN